MSVLQVRGPTAICRSGIVDVAFLVERPRSPRSLAVVDSRELFADADHSAGLRQSPAVVRDGERYLEDRLAILLSRHVEFSDERFALVIRRTRTRLRERTFASMVGRLSDLLLATARERRQLVVLDAGRWDRVEGQSDPPRRSGRRGRKASTRGEGGFDPKLTVTPNR
jgi:hypothetical protein